MEFIDSKDFETKRPQIEIEDELTSPAELMADEYELSPCLVANDGSGSLFFLVRQNGVEKWFTVRTD